MRIKGTSLNVGRPDLFAFKRNGMFALEAKGYSGSSGNMKIHNTQSQTGGIPVNFTVVCVSCYLYKNVQCKYHDPFNDSIKFDKELFRRLTRNYYKELSEFLNKKYFQFSEFEFQGETFYEVELIYHNSEQFFPDDFPFGWNRRFGILDYYRPRLILPKRIREYAENGLNGDEKPFVFDFNEDNNFYIDNDRIGLRIK